MRLRAAELLLAHELLEHPADRAHVEVVEDGRERGVVERGEGGEVLSVELEVEDVDVLLHARAAHRLGDHDDVVLDEGAQHHLGDGLAVLVGDAGEHLVLEDAVLSLGEGRPGLVRHAKLGHGFVRRALLVERVRLDLVDRGRHLGEGAYVREPLGVEVGDADGAELAGAIGVLHGAPRAGVVSHGLVEQHEVDVVGAERAQALVDRGGGPLVVHVGDPDLRGHEDLVAGHVALRDGGSHAGFVSVGLRGVDEAVARGERLGHAALGVLGRRLVHAEAEHGHLHAVVENLVFHAFLLKTCRGVLTPACCSRCALARRRAPPRGRCSSYAAAAHSRAPSRLR